MKSATALFCVFSQFAFASTKIEVSNQRESFISADPINNQLNFYDLVKTKSGDGNSSLFLTCQTKKQK